MKAERNKLFRESAADAGGALMVEPCLAVARR